MSSEERQLGWDKGPTGLLGDEEGESWWMPQPMGGYVTLKYVPATFPEQHDRQRFPGPASGW